MNIKIGNGYDVHALATGESLWLGGIEIPHSKGTIAHSDGDVLIHAMCDAMLGALALGDIGKHFPDTDNTFKNIDSKILLKQCNALINNHGYCIVNIDTTICAQQPKLRQYIDTMRTVLANILEIDVSQISVKATTTEKLGFVGREEGISAYAVVLLQKKE
jgi:2-C-methyl-D-erythritol 2,4-cyclodiphosphate synthase